MRRTTEVSCLLAFAAGCHGELDATDFSSFPLAYGTQIDKVAWLQGVETTLHVAPGSFGGGSRPPPVIMGRDAMLRVHVSRDEEFPGDEVAVVVKYDFGWSKVQMSRMVDVTDAWDQSDLDTTAAFEIPANAVTENLSFSVSVHDPYLGYRPEIEADPPVWSSDEGDFGLEPVPTDTVTIVILPVQYAGDGSQRLPDTSREAIDIIRRTVHAMYPVSAVNVEVAAPIVWTNPISAFGGWDALLNHITTLRTDADVPLNTYYYGLFNPAPDFGTYCQQGCILGLSNLSPSAEAGWLRASIGLGYVERAATTMVHELGHAHGRLHAGCGVNKDDGAFPYLDGRIGSWGYDLATRDLIDPLVTADIMSYCEPQWSSDYTFGALLDRVNAIAEVEQSSGPLSRAAPPVDWQLVQFDGAGVGTLHDMVQERVEPGGTRVEVELLGAGGQVVEVVEGWMGTYDHLPGGLALVPPIDQRSAVTGVRLRLP